MKKTTHLNLANLRDLAYAADLYMASKGEAVDAESLIIDVKHYLESFLSSFPEEYLNNVKLPVSFEDSKLRKNDRVKIIGSPIFHENMAMINYVGKEGVILQVLENGNFWVGILPSSANIPSIEIEPSALESI